MALRSDRPRERFAGQSGRDSIFRGGSTTMFRKTILTSLHVSSAMTLAMASPAAATSTSDRAREAIAHLARRKAMGEVVVTMD
jgi:hypothetical protein